jgi:hypothetical protein
MVLSLVVCAASCQLLFAAGPSSDEGLSGAATYGNAEGLVTVKRLDLYLSDRVRELTGGRQTPTTTTPPNVPDFPIAIKG